MFPLYYSATPHLTPPFKTTGLLNPLIFTFFTLLIISLLMGGANRQRTAELLTFAIIILSNDNDRKYKKELLTKLTRCTFEKRSIEY